MEEEDDAARFQETPKSALLTLERQQRWFCVTQCGAVPEEGRLHVLAQTAVVVGAGRISIDLPENLLVA
jgi:hypothetical protein